MGAAVGSRGNAAWTFAVAAQRYWRAVFPRLHHELRGWRRRAGGLPDDELRALALAVQESKRGNIEGAAAFAAFAPARHCGAVVRAQVAFQAIYDCVDSLAEQPHPEPVRNGRQLHSALTESVRSHPREIDFYACRGKTADAGYLKALVGACRMAVSMLPSRCPLQREILLAAERIVSYQSLNLGEHQGGLAGLMRWARAETVAGSGLRWWETAASAGSSLGVFAMLAIAAERDVDESQARAVGDAYFPWIGSLHSLLDSLVDAAEDAEQGQPNLIMHYADARETTARVSSIAAEAVLQARRLPNAARHLTILAGMVSFYLSAAEVQGDDAAVASAVLAAVGSLTGPAMLVFRLRRLARGGRKM